MSRVIEDVLFANLAVKGNFDAVRLGKIYYCSNERLDDLFANFSVKDKNVYSVLASSDQVFYSYLNGARSVDTFDRNRLTKYYYYLRKWIIEYYGIYYPSEKLLFDTNRYIEEILKKVECNGEEEASAYLFWSTFISLSLDLEDTNIFHYSKYIDDNNRCDDVLRLRDILINKELSFRYEDLSGDISRDKKYDVIITSNLMEYIHDPLVLKKARNNLYDILKEDGEVICSYVINEKNDLSSIREKDIFSELFDVLEFPYSGSCEYYRGRPLGYCYKKR